MNAAIIFGLLLALMLTGMPISIFTTISIPKCTGSMPSFMATGKRIGAMMRIMDEGSMTFPASSSMTLTTSRKTIGPSL